MERQTDKQTDRQHFSAILLFLLIQGTPDAIEQAKRMIAEKVGGGYGGGGDNYNGNYRQNDQPYGGGFDGGPPQGGYGGGGAPPAALPQPGGVQVNPATGQPVS